MAKLAGFCTWYFFHSYCVNLLIMFFFCSTKQGQGRYFCGIWLIISAKWTKWNWRILCFHFCLSVCLCIHVCCVALMPIARKRLKIRTSNLSSASTGTVRTRPLGQFLKKGAWPGWRDPLNCWALMPIARKWLKIRTSNLTTTSVGKVRTWTWENFWKRGVASVTWLPKFLGVMC